MTLIIPTGYAASVLHWTSPNFVGGRAATVIGWGEDLGPDPTSLSNFAGSLATVTVASILPLMDENTVLDRVEVYNEEDGVEEPVGEPGGGGFVCAAPNVACLVKKVVQGRGRRRQGRMFWPSILATGVVQENGLLTTTARNTIQAAFTDWLGDMTTATGVPMVILQNEEGETPPVTPPPVVQSLLVEARVASQRNRLRR